MARPTEPENAVWQTRTRPPTAYDLALIEALETVMANGTHDLPGIVSGLNKLGCRTEDGAAWTETNFAAEMKRLSA
jgi:hypothetical protein